MDYDGLVSRLKRIRIIDGMENYGVISRAFALACHRESNKGVDAISEFERLIFNLNGSPIFDSMYLKETMKIRLAKSIYDTADSISGRDNNYLSKNIFYVFASSFDGYDSSGKVVYKCIVESKGRRDSVSLRRRLVRGLLANK